MRAHMFCIGTNLSEAGITGKTNLKTHEAWGGRQAPSKAKHSIPGCVQVDVNDFQRVFDANARNLVKNNAYSLAMHFRKVCDRRQFLQYFCEVRAVFLCAKTVLPVPECQVGSPTAILPFGAVEDKSLRSSMLKTGYGRIVNIASISGKARNRWHAWLALLDHS